MGLSKKNLDKLNTFIKENNFVNKNNSSENCKKKFHNSPKLDEPSKIFYSLIDNSDNINDTSKENSILKKSEESLHNINYTNPNFSNNLSIEDQLYYEFNYLIDE